jgi:hypothetical protein
MGVRKAIAPEDARLGQKPAINQRACAARPVGVRWTIGDVSDRGFEALRLSIWGAWKIFGPSASYAVCVNTITPSEASKRTGLLPAAVDWHDATRDLPQFLSPMFGAGMAEGVGWKLAPLRFFSDRHEISLDNDCVLWELPPSMQAWLASTDTQECLMAQDVKLALGQFAGQCPPVACNSGIRGLPAGFDLEGALREVIAVRQRQLGATPCCASELDEQGLQTAAVTLAHPLRMVALQEVSICSPFHPHLPELGRYGAHFVGLNARHIARDYYDRPADAWMTDHCQRHRPELYRRTGAPWPAAFTRQPAQVPQGVSPRA